MSREGHVLVILRGPTKAGDTSTVYKTNELKIHEVSPVLFSQAGLGPVKEGVIERLNVC
jgi:hypothetical protein